MIEWDFLIEEHYLSACKVNPKYAEKYTREEMKKWWYGMIDRNRHREHEIKNFIEGSIHANNNRYKFHPV